MAVFLQGIHGMLGRLHIIITLISNEARVAAFVEINLYVALFTNLKRSLLTHFTTYTFVQITMKMPCLAYRLC